jgi:hypothetical protein
VSGDDRFVKTPFGKMRSDDWLRWQLRKIEPAPKVPDHEWQQIVAAYRAIGKLRPKQIEVAQQLGYDTEQPLRDRLRARGIPSWRKVHAAIAREPE